MTVPFSSTLENGSVAKFESGGLVVYELDPGHPTNPFKGRQYPGDVIITAVRWYLRYPLAYLHVTEILAERGLFVDASCIWRWVQAYGPEVNKRRRPHLKSTNNSYRINETYTDETYIKVKGEDRCLYRAVDSTGQTNFF